MSATTPTFVRLGLVTVLAALSGGAHAQPIPATLKAKLGDPLGGGTISTLNAPFTDGNGKVGFVGSLSDSQRFVWWDTGPVFYSGQALPDVLVGGESTMGVSNTGGFIYSPSFNGADAVYTHHGKLLADDDPAPGLPGYYSTFNSRPQMRPDGTALWVGGLATAPGGSSIGRVMWRCPDPANPASTVAVLKTGDVIGGQTIDTSGIDFDYCFSDNGLHHIQALDMTGATATDEFMYVDGALIAREGSPTGAGDNWKSFGSVSINNPGNYLFTGTTSAATTSDQFLAYNGIISVREGDTLDGVLLASGWAISMLSLNDLNQAAYVWGTTNNRHLFFGDAANLMGSVELLATNDVIDIDGDGWADYSIADINGSGVVGPALDLAEDGLVYLDVDLQRLAGGDTVEAIISIAVPEPGTCGLLLLALLALRRR